MPTTTSDAAPHGYDEAGNPKAPFGYKTNGEPRRSNRGARPGQQGNRPPAGVRNSPARPKANVSNLSDQQRKDMLLSLSDSFLVAPLASLSQVPWVAGRIGQKQADAFAADAFIISQTGPGIADGLILLSKTKPGLLSWMDKAEENAPFLILAQAIAQTGKEFIRNHMRPDPSFAAAGRNYANIRMAQMAEAINHMASQGEEARQEAAAAYNRPEQPQFSDAA